MRWNYVSIPNSTVKIGEWISNFIQHFSGHVITYPYCDLSWSMLVNVVPGSIQYTPNNTTTILALFTHILQGHYTDLGQSYDCPSKGIWVNTVRCRYNAVNFLQNHHKRHSIARPLEARYGVSFVGSHTHLNSGTVPAVIGTISCYTGPRYNGTRLYITRIKRQMDV